MANKIISTGNGIGVEDEGLVNLPINAHLIDRNENISEIVITGSKGEISQVVFMAPKGFEGLPLDGFLNQVDNIFTIDSASWAANAISVHSNLTDVKSAQELLAGNLGVKTALNVSGNISVNVSYSTATAIDPSIKNISSQDLILEIDPRPEHITEDDAPILLSMYPGLEDLQGEPPLPSKASVNFEIIGAQDGDTELGF